MTPKQIVNRLAFALVLPIAGITYFVVDNYRFFKKKKQEEAAAGPKPSFHSYYPDNYPANPTASDFNTWSEHIYSLNNLKK